MNTDSAAGATGATGATLWPEGFRAAVALTFDVDAESVMLASDPSLAQRASLMSHQRYGPQAGLPRILGDLARPHVRDREPGNGDKRDRAMAARAVLTRVGCVRMPDLGKRLRVMI